LSTAQKALAGVMNDLRQAQETLPEYTAADAALTSAESDYQAELAAVRAELAQRNDFQAIVKAKQAAQDAVQRARDSGECDPGVLASLAAPMLLQASAQSKLETAALDASSSLQAAKSRLARAQQAMDALKQTMEDRLRGDPSYLAAKQAFDSATGKWNAAYQAMAEASQNNIR
jgi:DNA repair exonuclease SbcCD ATPase subunit